MKKIILFLLVLTAFVSCGEDKGNTNTSDKCKDVICDEWKECNETSGSCELKSQRCERNSDCTGVQLCDINHNCVNPENPCEGQSCSNHGVCATANNIIACICDSGYTAEGLSCVDSDECLLNIDNCGENSNCTNTDGTFNCECTEGYSGDGIICEDIDECDLNMDNCLTGYVCENTIGSFKCVDIDECELNTDDCLIGYICENTEGTFDCNDIDECERGLDDCTENANCNNVNGSFYCTCKDGFYGNVTNCQDFDECLNNTHNCAEGYECVNTIGSFNCDDANECELNTYNCDEGYVCENTQSSYVCNDFCGNGIKTENEICDGNQTGINTCQTLGFTKGNLSCNDICEYSLSDCSITRQWGTIGFDNSTSVAVDNNGNKYITGITTGSFEGYTNQGGSDVFLSKYDISNNLIWTKQTGTTAQDEVTSVAVDNNGNVFVTGMTWGSLPNNNCLLVPGQGYCSADAFLMKFDSNGNILWVKQWGTSSFDQGSSVAVDNQGNAYIAGHTEYILDINVSGTDVFLTKINTSGEIQWTKQFGTDTYDKGYGVAVDNSGNVYVTGETRASLYNNTYFGNTDVFLIKYDNIGTLLWAKQFGTPQNEEGHSVTVDNSGNIYITGYTTGVLSNVHNGSTDVFFAKYASNGTQEWIKQVGTTGDEIGFSIAVDNSENIYITGYTTGNLDGIINQGGDCNEMFPGDQPCSDIFLTKYNQQTRVWTKQWGTDNSEISMDLALYNSSIIVTGYVYQSLDGQPHSGNSDAFMSVFQTE